MPKTTIDADGNVGETEDNKTRQMEAEAKQCNEGEQGDREPGQIHDDMSNPGWEH